MTTITAFNYKINKPSVEKTDAYNLLNMLKDEIFNRIRAHKEAFDIFWHSDTTPEKIALAMKNKGGMFYRLSGESVRHIMTGLTLCGLDINSNFPPEYYTPPNGKKIIINSDETISIVDG